MLHEFALDPATISDRASARYFFDAFKPEKGRLISQFPKRWKRLVYDHCRSILPEGTSLKYIEEKLRKMDGSLVKSGRSFDPGIPWVINAVEAHKQDPFRAIISPTPGPGILSEDVDEDSPAWKMDACISVIRRAGEMVQGCRGLLRKARELIFVDPYFDASSAQMRVFNAFLAEALLGLPLERIEYHVKEQRLDHHAYERRIEQDILVRLRGLAVPLYIIRWQDAEETLHDRYILTDIAGVSVPQGLAECRAEEADTTDISLLSHEVFELRKNQYSPANVNSLKFVDGWCIHDGTICQVKPTIGDWEFL
jgi:hypothetical protein